MHWIALQLRPDAPTAPVAPVAPMAPVDAPEPTGSAALADAASALGWWALQFSPKVAWVEGTLVMEVSASERLFGGRRALLKAIQQEKIPLSLVDIQQGATSLIAVARLHPLAVQARSRDDLPLAALAAARAHLATLATLGCTCWGELRALPRGGVARRFGAALVDALDQAYGLRPDTYPWLVLPEVFEARLDLAARVDNAPALMFGARRLLAQLQLWLQLRQRGVLAFELGWVEDSARLRARAEVASDGASGVVIRTAEPTVDLAHLQRLLGEHLTQLRLATPVEALTLRSLETAALPGTSASLLPDVVQAGDSLQHLLERLGARLGPQAVQRAVPQADHRPEHMQVWQSALAPAGRPSGVVPEYSNLIANKSIKSSGKGQKSQASDALYPTWLLADPLRLEVHRQVPQYQGALTLLAGPQRIEAGWWAQAADGAAPTAALRDYFIAQNPQAQWLWVYRERLGERRGAPQGQAPEAAHWYLHGLYA